MLLFLLFLGVTPRDSQGLVLALHSGKVKKKKHPGDVCGTILDVRDLPTCKTNTLPAVLSLRPPFITL